MKKMLVSPLFTLSVLSTLVLSACSNNDNSNKLLSSESLSVPVEQQSIAEYSFGESIVPGSSVEDKQFTFLKSVESSENASSEVVLSNTTDFALVSTKGCNVELTSKGLCYVKVRFLKSKVSGDYSGELNVGGAQVLLTAKVAAATSGTSSLVVKDGSTPLSSLVVDFGNLNPKATLSKIFTLTNEGTSTVSLAVALEGSNYVIQSKTCSTTLAKAKSCSIKVLFSAGTGAASNEEKTGVLTLSPSLAYDLTAMVIGSSASGSADIKFYESTTLKTSVDFGSIASGSVSKIVTIKNEGSQSSSSSVSLTGDSAFIISSNTCSTLAAGKSCAIKLTLKALGESMGAKTATLTLGSSSLALTGTLSSSQTPQVPVCSSTEHLESNICVANTRTCVSLPSNATAGTEAWASGSWGSCSISSCSLGFNVENNVCVAGEATSCPSGYSLDMGTCYANNTSTVLEFPKTVMLTDRGVLAPVKKMVFNSNGFVGMVSTLKERSRTYFDSNNSTIDLQDVTYHSLLSPTGLLREEKDFDKTGNSNPWTYPLMVNGRNEFILQVIPSNAGGTASSGNLLIKSMSFSDFSTKQTYSYSTVGVSGPGSLVVGVNSILDSRLTQTSSGIAFSLFKNAQTVIMAKYNSVNDSISFSTAETAASTTAGVTYRGGTVLKVNKIGQSFKMNSTGSSVNAEAELVYKKQDGTVEKQVMTGYAASNNGSADRFALADNSGKAVAFLGGSNSSTGRTTYYVTMRDNNTAWTTPVLFFDVASSSMSNVGTVVPMFSDVPESQVFITDSGDVIVFGKNNYNNSAEGLLHYKKYTASTSSWSAWIQVPNVINSLPLTPSIGINNIQLWDNDTIYFIASSQMSWVRALNVVMKFSISSGTIVESLVVSDSQSSDPALNPCVSGGYSYGGVSVSDGKFKVKPNKDMVLLASVSCDAGAVQFSKLYMNVEKMKTTSLNCPAGTTSTNGYCACSDGSKLDPATNTCKSVCQTPGTTYESSQASCGCVDESKYYNTSSKSCENKCTPDATYDSGSGSCQCNDPVNFYWNGTSCQYSGDLEG